ncbi:hypothetical protein RJ639_002029 [Escallonia herrerae]|uniref:Uncharacterized protein n=1 Tax=Escallonia herrerae TaxID=1293975 RepID=A0AA88XJ85_9ASTE|nr:hypothetical protein RJ639_002029 [Escallonia herrerae]
MADNTVFITSITGSFSGSAVHMNTSTPGNSSSPGRFSGLTVRDTGRHGNACVRIHMKVKMSSEVYSRNNWIVNYKREARHWQRRIAKIVLAREWLDMHIPFRAHPTRIYSADQLVAYGLLWPSATRISLSISICFPSTVGLALTQQLNTAYIHPLLDPLKDILPVAIDGIGMKLGINCSNGGGG